MEGDLVDIKISDQGIGLTFEQQQTIFKPFTRFQRRLADGAGLGLAVTKQLVEENGGTISVSSKYGQGSVFSVHLPAYSLHDDCKDMKVLYIEDCADSRAAFIRSLRPLGLQIVTAHDFVEAESILRFQDFDAIITDLKTGSGDIQSLFEIVKQKESIPEIMILSGNAIQNADLSNATVVKKPARIEEITGWLRLIAKKIPQYAMCSAATGTALTS